MIDIHTLGEIIIDQTKNFREKEPGTRRDINFKKYLKTKQMVVISGVRRSGKSTLLKQFSAYFEQFYYFNFDDERLLDFEVSDFQNLMLAFRKIHTAKTILLDEIQNVPKWERFVRRIHDEGYKVFLTGSNAKLLGSDLASHLTGRYFKLELYPFSFKEYLKFKGYSDKNLGSEAKVKILRGFQEYLLSGGFPEFLKTGDSEYLKRAYEDILYKDILTRFRIREVKAFRELASFVFSNFTKEISYNGLKNTLGFKNVMSVKNYLQFMQESYLVFELLKYDFSLKKQYISNKKAYVIDNGLRNTVAFSFSEDSGKLLENLVFVELKRRAKEVYYYKGKKECDFIIREKNKITEVIQVTQRLEAGNEKRELGGMSEALERFRLKIGLIITQNQEGQKKIAGKKIKLIPAWKWLLSDKLA